MPGFDAVAGIDDWQDLAGDAFGLGCADAGAGVIATCPAIVDGDRAVDPGEGGALQAGLLGAEYPSPVGPDCRRPRRRCG